MFTPIWGNDSHFDYYFSNGLVQPPTRSPVSPNSHTDFVACSGTKSTLPLKVGFQWRTKMGFPWRAWSRSKKCYAKRYLIVRSARLQLLMYESLSSYVFNDFLTSFLRQSSYQPIWRSDTRKILPACPLKSNCHESSRDVEMRGERTLQKSFLFSNCAVTSTQGCFFPLEKISRVLSRYTP